MRDHTQSTLNPTQKPRILSILSLVVTFIPLTPSCPLLFYHQDGLQKTEMVGELVHGAHHHLCSDLQLLHPASGEILLMLLDTVVLSTYQILYDS